MDDLPVGAEPGLAVQADATNSQQEALLFSAFAGTFRRHPWLDGETAPPLHYLLGERNRSLAWADPERVEWPRWTAHEAEPDLPAEGRGNPVASFFTWIETAGLGSPPVRRHLICCHDALSRLGQLDLSEVQTLLPLDGSRRSAQGVDRLTAAGEGWWLCSEPAAQTRIRVSLDSGRDPAAPDATPVLVERLVELDLPVVRPQAQSVRQEASPPPLGLTGHLWPGPATRRATFDATIAEWSIDAVGWLADLLGDLAAEQRVRTPLLLTVTR